MEFTSDLEGTTIYGMPTGNNARRWKGPLVKFEVVKVKRRYVELLQEGHTRSYNYDKKSGATQEEVNAGYSGLNGGWRFFYTMADYRHYDWRMTLCDNICSMARQMTFQNRVAECSDEDLRKLEHIFLKLETQHVT